MRSSGSTQVHLSRDVLKLCNLEAEGLPLDQLGLDGLERLPGNAQWRFLDEHGPELSAQDLRDTDILLLFGAQLPRAAIELSPRLVLVARWGVGIEHVDVPACSELGVMVSTTPDGVRRPMAEGCVTLILAALQRLLLKDRLVRAGNWVQRFEDRGFGLEGRTVGLVGYGNIGRDVAKLLEPFAVSLAAYDPYVSDRDIQRTGVTPLALDELLATADVVCLLCPLTEETRNLLDRRRLQLMRETSVLINVARGGLVDQDALLAVLKEGRIRGAALDVFAEEPLDPRDPLLQCENLIVSPHSIGMTDRAHKGMGANAVRNIQAALHGETPPDLINRDVLESASFIDRWQRLGERTGWAAENVLERTS